jgi:glucose/arabinose dehydrogenase
MHRRHPSGGGLASLGPGLVAVAVVVAVVAGCVGPSASPAVATGPVTGSPAATPSSTAAASAASSPTPASSTGGPLGEPPQVDLEPVVGDLESPLDIAWRPDDPTGLFVAEQDGRIRIVRDGALVERPLLDIRGMVTAGGEQGFLGLAFHPEASDRRFFVYYTDLDGDQVVASYRTLPDARDRADPDSATILLRMDDRFGNHNGGGLAFGPDGYLYVATGDGGGGGDPLDSGRNLDTLLAKILRLDVDVEAGADPAYGIPDDNPFVDVDQARPEIWLTGLRNPWRIRFDRATGDLWIGDVGQSQREEIDVARAGVGGLDFGWNIMEGSTCYRDGGDDCLTDELTLPVAEYGHDQGCSVIGGTVYRGERQPALRGWYVLSDNCSGRFWVLDPTVDELREPTLVLDSQRSISAIGEDAAGELFATDLFGGELLRVVVDGG